MSASREADRDALTVARDAGVADVLVAEQAAQVGSGGVKPLGQRPLHVHLQQEMHAAAQVEAEVHRRGMHARQPLRRGRQQVERDHILRILRVGIELLLEQVLRLQLGVGVLEADLDTVGVEENAVMDDASGLQRGLGAIERLRVDLDRCLDAAKPGRPAIRRRSWAGCR